MAHDCPPLAEQIRDGIPLIQSYLDDGRLSYNEVVGFGTILSHVACRIFKAAENPSQSIDELADAAEYVWDAWLAPLDIYGIPDGIENAWLKPGIRASIRPMIRVALAGS